MAGITSQAADLGVSRGAARTTGLKIPRYFTRAGMSPYDEIEWELRTASIANEKGKVVFEQSNVEIPKAWSLMATQVVVSKYFRGPLGTPQREHSVRQMIGRVVETIASWGKKDGYFATEEDAQAFSDELTHIMLHQKACFNSPVWFNCGIEEKQGIGGGEKSGRLSSQQFLMMIVSLIGSLILIGGTVTAIAFAIRR